MKDLTYKHIHFIGIGGISMSALAKFCLNRGIQVSGSDKTKSNITEELTHLGALITYKHSKNNILGADAIVYTCAINKNNEELIAAQKSGFPLFERAEFLGLISRQYKKVIAVSGTHGKTTTTGMIASIFEEAGFNPTVHMGGIDLNYSDNLKIGSNKFFITEACEYNKNFLHLTPNTTIVLNVEHDHPDCYRNENAMFKAFKRLCDKTKNCVILPEKLKNAIEYKPQKIKKTIEIENGRGVFSIKEIYIKNNKYCYTVLKNEEPFLTATLNIAGVHNVINSLYAIACADYYKIAPPIIQKGLLNYKGVKRRFEVLKMAQNSLIITDYAHHPTEIESTIKTAKELYKKPVVAVFEPHTYSRTKTLFREFQNALNLADYTIIMPTFSAREKTIKSASGKALFTAINRYNKNCFYAENIKQIKKALQEIPKIKTPQNLSKKSTNLSKNFIKNIVLFLGAGDIDNTAKQYLREAK